jgi:hypothetical protein
VVQGGVHDDTRLIFEALRAGKAFDADAIGIDTV